MKTAHHNHEALEKDVEVRYKKRDKRKSSAMRVHGSKVKTLAQLIKNK
jgi:hypothetical protein